MIHEYLSRRFSGSCFAITLSRTCVALSGWQVVHFFSHLVMTPTLAVEEEGSAEKTEGEARADSLLPIQHKEELDAILLSD